MTVSIALSGLSLDRFPPAWTTITSRPTASWPIFVATWPSEPSIAFDTEFVSEHTYRPELCLIQVAAGDRLAVIDPQTIDDVTAILAVAGRAGP